MELLCACPLVDLSVMDQWNRTVSDVATAECKEVLANRGRDVPVLCACIYTYSLPSECQEVGISLDLTEEFGSQGKILSLFVYVCMHMFICVQLGSSYHHLCVTFVDYTIISHIRVFKYHCWTDFDILVGDALTVHCQDLCRRNTSIRSKPLSGCSSAGSLAGILNGSSSNSNNNSPVSTSKQKLNRKANPLEILGR